MVLSRPLIVLGMLCCGQAAAGSELLGSPVALVQSGVRVHPPALPSSGRFLMDNSELQHSGPGVLLRRSKNLDDLAGRDSFVKWGTLIDGEKTEDGWVKYQGYYLPMKMRGAQVLTEQVVETALQRQEVATEAKANATAPQKRRFQPRFKYSATEFETSKGKNGESVWVNCDILRPGKLPDTYDITVRPRSFTAYNITDVPASSLKKVQKTRVFTAMKNHAPKQLKLARQQDDSMSSIKLLVNDTRGNTVMDLKMFRKSPMRTVMKMACERAKISWFKCEKKVNFIWKGNPIHPDDSFQSLGLESGHTILMVK